MATEIVGRVSIVPKGDWANNQEYKRLDLVMYQGTLYLCKRDDTPIGTLPTNTTYFMSTVSNESSLPSNVLTTNNKGVPNGVASLDSGGRIPYSQLPESAMEFKGTWNASTNTPELEDGVGTNGDFYICSAGGVWNGITFGVDDRIIYDGDTGEWHRLGAGTVIDNLNSSSSTSALSANQGRILNEKIRNIRAGTADLTAGTSSLTTGDIYFVYE